jgi:hypothetical protein
VSSRLEGRREPQALTAPSTAAQPRNRSRGLLILQSAILRDAAADLARIERRMVGAQSRALVLQEALAAADLLDHTAGLLHTQRAALLEDLAAALLSRDAPSRPSHLRGGPTRPPIRLADGA